MEDKRHGNKDTVNEEDDGSLACQAFHIGHRRDTCFTSNSIGKRSTLVVGDSRGKLSNST